MYFYRKERIWMLGGGQGDQTVGRSHNSKVEHITEHSMESRDNPKDRLHRLFTLLPNLIQALRGINITWVVKWRLWWK